MFYTCDMIGKSFHYWTVKALLDKDHWQCVCKCGTERRVHGGSLRQGKSKSCGCWGVERYPLMNKTHGYARSPEYRIWAAMKTRCSNPNAINYARYGVRGISVCEQWQSFASFIADMGPRPSPEHSIDRKDNDGDYCPDNCLWAPVSQQVRNKRTNVFLMLNGEKVTAAEYARHFGIPLATMYGWTMRKLSAEEIQFRTHRLISRQKATLDKRSRRSTRNA
jgi:hypothetical protein